MIDIGNGKSIAPAIETVFPLMFEQLKNGLPEGVNFDACNFWHPPMNKTNAVNNILDALQFTGAITDGREKDIEQDGIAKVKFVDESSTNGCLKRTIEFTNLK